MSSLKNLTILAIGIVIGAGATTLLNPKLKTVVEQPEKSERQRDGSLILEKHPQSSAVAPHQIPAGSTLVRSVAVQFRPKSEPIPGCGASQNMDPSSDPNWKIQDPLKPASGTSYTIAMSIVKMSDGQQRVIASSPDGEIIGGIDIPVTPTLVTPVYTWGVGGSYNVADKTYGIVAEKDLGRLRLGAMVHQQLNIAAIGGRSLGATVWAVWRF
jgi:hypothetical protein